MNLAKSLHFVLNVNGKHHPGLKLFLSLLENEIFDKLQLDNSPSKSNITSEKWKALQALAGDRSTAIKPSRQGFLFGVLRQRRLHERSKKTAVG